MARGQRDPVRERQWRERVARWATSGLSVRAFCRQHGWIETSFYHWQRELRARDEAAAATAVTAASNTTAASAATASATATTSSATMTRAKSPARKRPLTKKSPPVFVPVTVLAGSTLSVEVRCPSGHVVLLPSCDVASLTSLFAALTPLAPEARSC